MTSSARLLLVERVALPGNEPQVAKLLDLAMLSFPGGRERTATEWEALLRGAGFALTRIVPTEAGVSIIESQLDMSGCECRVRWSVRRLLHMGRCADWP